MRIATFNLENLDDREGLSPSLSERLAILKPQLSRINADVLCLQEVNSQRSGESKTLAALDALVEGTIYETYHRATTQTIEGELYSERNLVTLSRFEILQATSIRDSSAPRPRYQLATAEPPDLSADPVKWERPVLYTTLALEDGTTLHLMNVHMKSKIATSIPGQKIDNYTWKSVAAWAEGSFISSMKRVGQALQVRLQIDKIFDEDGLDSLIAACGDFNAETDEVPVKTICGPVEETGNPAHSLRVMIPCENNIPMSSRYSLFYLGKGEMIDHILVSRPLIRYFSHAEIHNEILPDESGAFRVDAKFPESDHAPVIAEFNSLRGRIR